MSNVLWRQWHNYSGCLVRAAGPKIQLPINTDRRHISAAIWLTSQLEAPSYGLVQSYDGAAMSAGLLHNIAVQPKSMEQGDFFGLLRAMFDGGLAAPLRTSIEVSLLRPCDEANRFGRYSLGWTITADGKLRDATGKLVTGWAIRNEFTPDNGVVPETGPKWEQAAGWAGLFGEAFSDPSGFTAQNAFAERWLARGNKANEIAVYRRFAEQPTLDSMIGIHETALPEPVHFAMCVYHSFSVNGPAPAATCLRAALTETDPTRFARSLIRLLGKSAYGRWHDEAGDGTNRYDRTRAAVNTADGKELFSDAARALMPRDLA